MEVDLVLAGFGLALDQADLLPRLEALLAEQGLRDG